MSFGKRLWHLEKKRFKSTNSQIASLSGRKTESQGATRVCPVEFEAKVGLKPGPPGTAQSRGSQLPQTSHCSLVTSSLLGYIDQSQPCVHSSQLLPQGSPQPEPSPALGGLDPPPTSLAPSPVWGSLQHDPPPSATRTPSFSLYCLSLSTLHNSIFPRSRTPSLSLRLLGCRDRPLPAALPTPQKV